MEELEEFMPDFDEWLKNYVEPERKFGAAFEPDTGQLVCVGPFVAVQLEYEHITEIDEDIAVKIIDGEIKISNCFFDTNEGKFEITEEKVLNKIDDVLHRIVDKRWTDDCKPDIYLTYNKDAKTLKVELSEEFNGTKVLDNEWQPAGKRKMFWSGETILSFTVADYNDPHFPQQMFDVKLEDLNEKFVVINDVDITGKFGIYTRRLFKNYVLEEI